MESVWSKSVRMPSFEPLCGDTKTDVLVIGGGIAGLLCAYMLQSAGADCILVEASRICKGITENTTAKITSQHGLIYSKLISRFGTEKAGLYLEANQNALDKLRDLCSGIDCDFENRDNCVYSRDNLASLETELEALQKLRFPALLRTSLPLPFGTKGAVVFENQAQFNPLKFLSAVARELKIYENTAVRSVSRNIAHTDRGKIKAGQIIVATHFPFINKRGLYFLKMYQSRSYVTALENAPLYDGMYIDADENGFSFRSYENLLLLGGGTHRTGKSGGGFRAVSELAARSYPNASEVCSWATQDCMTLDGVPYIGRYSRNTQELLVATGFNKWGMTSSVASACILADLALGRKNIYAEVFSPSRTMLRPQLAVNGFEAVKSLATFSKKRCPHLGCALKYNKREHSWDCPCHGSRFGEDGRLIDNPATGNLKIKE